MLGEPFLLLHILSFLPAADLGRATLVCRHFYAVGAQDGDYLWRNLLAQDRKLEDWRDVRRKETARAYVTNDRLFARAWQSGDLQVVTLSGHKICKLESCGPFLIGFKMVERTSPEIMVWDFFRERQGPVAPLGLPGGSRLQFVGSPVPLHIIPSLNPPVHLRVERKRRRDDMEADDVESEVQHLVVGTFHTNLYHSLRNDWPTTPIALTRSNTSYQPYEGEEDKHIVDPYPLETNKVVLNSCQFTEFPSELVATLPRHSRWTSKPVLHHLDLRFNKITAIPDSVFQRLSNIRVLILSNNRFASYPTAITHLKDTLEFLDIGDNNIPIIPPVIAALTNLTFLRLSKNPINESPLPDQLGLLTKLQNLRLYKTGISEVPPCVTRLVNLMELDFGECNLRELPEGITALTKLRILRLDNNKLNHLPEHLFDALDLTELTSADNLGISTAGVEERMRDAVKRHSEERVDREIKGEFDYSDESNYYQGIRVYDLATGAALRTFGRRGDYLYHVTRQLPCYVTPTPANAGPPPLPAAQLVFNRSSSSTSLSSSGDGGQRPSALLATTGSIEGGATFWDALQGRALHMFTPHTPPESDTDEEPQLQSHSPKIPPLILTFNIDELLILYDQTTFSVYDLATSTMLHERVCVVETPADTEQTSTTARQLIKTMRALDGVIFVHLKNPNRYALYDPRTAKLLLQLRDDCPARHWVPIKNKDVPKGRVVLRSRSNVEMWDLFDTAAGGRKVLSYEGHRDVVYCLVQTGDLLFSGGSDGVRVWNLHTGECLRILLELIPHHVVDMCVLNHTLFIVDSTGFLRAYVPSHLIEEPKTPTEEPAPSEAEEESMSMRELGPALDECVWERYLQTDQEEGPSKELASLSARLGLTDKHHSSMITTKTEITCTTCEPFLSETMKRRKEEIAGSSSSALSLFGPTGSEVCAWCASHCHRGHPLSYNRHAMAGAVLFSFLSTTAVSSRHCTCGVCGHASRALERSSIISIEGDKCSYEVVGEGRSVWQRHVYCQTCANFDQVNDPICMACARRCHAGHALVAASAADDVTCQCGVKHHKCRSREEMARRNEEKHQFLEDLLRLSARALIGERVPLWSRQYFRLTREEYLRDLEQLESGEESEAVWRAKHAAEEDKLNSKVSRMFACFFASGELDPEVFDLLADLVAEESGGEITLRRPTDTELEDLAGAFGESSYYALLCSPTSRPFPREGKGLLILPNPPHFYFF